MLNTDLLKRVLIQTNEMEWTDSPAAGVSRNRLAREEEERECSSPIIRANSLLCPCKSYAYSYLV